jgi:hypothetical protein
VVQIVLGEFTKLGDCLARTRPHLHTSALNRTRETGVWAELEALPSVAPTAISRACAVCIHPPPLSPSRHGKSRHVGSAKNGDLRRYAESFAARDVHDARRTLRREIARRAPIRPSARAAAFRSLNALLRVRIANAYRHRRSHTVTIATPSRQDTAGARRRCGRDACHRTKVTEPSGQVSRRCPRAETLRRDDPSGVAVL